MLLERPIIVLGSPRSGTTVLAELLAEHPTLAYAEEPRLTWKYGNDRRSDLLRREHARPEVVRHIRDQFEAVVRDAGKQRLLEKSPSNAIRGAFVDAVFPDALFVHVMRNGFDTALSIRAFWNKHTSGVPRGRLLNRLKEARPSQFLHYGPELLRRAAPKPLRRLLGGPVPWGTRLPGLTKLAEELHPLELAALQWRASVEAACQFGRALPPERYLELRLEDLNETALQRVCAFCGLEAPDPVLQRYRARFRDGDATGRTKAANPDDLAIIRPWIEPTMAWLGYA